MVFNYLVDFILIQMSRYLRYMSYERQARSKKRMDSLLHVRITGKGRKFDIDTLFENPKKSTRASRGEFKHRLRVK